MANEVQIFESAEFGKVRTVVVKDEPWFVASDVCESLGLSNPTVSVNRLDEDERSKFNLGRQGEVNVVNEYGLYNLILGSRKDEAKRFKRWITHEVVPAIRKTGSYTAKHAKSDDVMQSKRLEVMERNARTRAANLLLKIAERTCRAHEHPRIQSRMQRKSRRDGCRRDDSSSAHRRAKDLLRDGNRRNVRCLCKQDRQVGE